MGPYESKLKGRGHSLEVYATKDQIEDIVQRDPALRRRWLGHARFGLTPTAMNAEEPKRISGQ
jgi:hypothetical protein